MIVVHYPMIRLFQLKGKNEFLLLLAGANLILLNFILVEHFVVALRQPEMAVILFSLSYFSGISLGYFISDKISFNQIQRVLPAFLLIQMGILIFGQNAVYALNEIFDPWTTMVMVFAVVTLFSTSLYSIFLPIAIESQGSPLSRLYSVEISGSILGLLLIPLLAGISHEWLLLAYFGTLLGIGAMLGMTKPRLCLWALIVLIFLVQFDSWDKFSSRLFYQHQYPSKNVQKVVYTKFTPYHKIEVVKLKNDEFMLVLNGKRQFAPGSHYNYSYFVAEYPARLMNSPEVSVLGCGSMSTVGRIGPHARSIHIVDLDEDVFKVSRRYFQPFNRLNELSNWSFTADDAKHYLANTHETFDLILHDIPPARSRQTALTYTAEFFSLVKARLKPAGLFSISSLTPLHSRSEYGKKMIATLAHVFDRYFVVLHKNSVYFYGGKVGMANYDRQTLLNAVEHPDKENVRILLKEEVDALVRGEKIITINNVGDLIFG